ncbi:MAG: helix-turn-helix transcriptional regulator [Deltaproteobacteria bacterium]|nr:helix-turn-helix transcriptional regulator [Deltaproteobacteria bacterium]
MRAALTGLRELVSEDPSLIRKRILSLVQDVSEGEAVSFWSLAETEQGAAPVRFQSVGIDEGRASAYWRAVRAIDFTNPLLDPRRPKRGTSNRYVPAIATGFAREFERTPYYDTVWRPLRLHDHLRGYLYHGGRFLGSLTPGRFSGTPAFSRRDALRMKQVLPEVQAALLTAQAFEAGTNAVDLVVRPDGRIEFASDDGATWLSVPGFRGRVAAVVGGIERGALGEVENLALASVRWSRLHGAGGHRYLLHLAPIAPVSIAADAMLTPAQRRVAEYLAAGATIAETAREVGMAHETVRAHLREAYHRLGVASRLELAAALRR